MTTNRSLLTPPPYALQIPAFWTSIDFRSTLFVDDVVTAAVTAVPGIDVARLIDQLRAAQELALSLGITKCHALAREIDDTIVIMSVACAIVRIVPEPSEGNMEFMMRYFRSADGVDFDVLPMMSIATGVSGEILRAERVIPVSSERSPWENRMICYGIMHPTREVMAMLVGTSPNVHVPEIGDHFDAIAESFFWIG